ncbi:hypothetical protein HY339_01045 [Candidatus Gottesmanbacteria bacterium]|nr:hypothetical protein [Candidatus Gottesmanbacteria bacterium]
MIGLAIPSRHSPKKQLIVSSFLRTRSAIEFLGLWEKLNNPNFNSIEFDGFKNGAGSNSFVLSPSKWMLKTRADSVGTISTGPSATTQSYCYCPDAVFAGQQRCGKIEKRVKELV